jgi:hypothetical protein
VTELASGDMSYASKKAASDQKTCIVCRASRLTEPDLTLHRPPRDKEQRKIWENILGISGLDKYFVCHLHFAPAEYREGSAQLKRGAVPFAPPLNDPLPEPIFHQPAEAQPPPSSEPLSQSSGASGASERSTGSSASVQRPSSPDSATVEEEEGVGWLCLDP